MSIFSVFNQNFAQNPWIAGAERNKGAPAESDELGVDFSKFIEDVLYFSCITLDTSNNTNKLMALPQILLSFTFVSSRCCQLPSWMWRIQSWRLLGSSFDSHFLTTSGLFPLTNHHIGIARVTCHMCPERLTIFTPRSVWIFLIL